MIKDLVIKTRSYRSFDASRAVSRRELADMVDTARLTASSRNIQPLRFRLVHTPEECAAMLPLTGWAAGLKDIKLPPEGHAPTAYIVICGDMTLINNVTPFMRDVGIAAQTIMLAATEMELGGCMIGSFNAQHVSETLSLPENIQPLLVLALGKPDETVMLTEARDGDVVYYRHDGVHYSPKRSLEEIIL